MALRPLVAIASAILAALPSWSAAEELKVDRIVLDIPAGGMTLTTAPRSKAEFKHRQHEIEIIAEVQAAANYIGWERYCTPGKGGPDPAYKIGQLARTDEHLYSTIWRFSRHGISTLKGTWRESCLIFRSGDLAAKIGVHFPQSALERNDISAETIEQMFSSAKLVSAAVERRSTTDPRLVFDVPDGFSLSAKPTFTFFLQHNRLPLYFNVSIGDPSRYDLFKRLGEVSAMGWTSGGLPRTDEYSYYFLTRHSLPPKSPSSFSLSFRSSALSAHVGMGRIDESALGNSEISVAAIERILAGARTAD
jgi:hypothetical protein